MNWMKYLKLYFGISLFIIIPGLVSLIFFGLKPSIEFTGGTRISLAKPALSSTKVLEFFKNYEPSLEFQNKDEIVIKTKTISQQQVDKVLENLKKEDKQVILSSFETIGPALGKETLNKTLMALLLASLMLLLYISYAFKQFSFGLCAVIAMLHDSLVLIGSFSLLGHFFNIEVDLLFVTAVLTILSFSVHDTVVVYDRIRELSHKTKGIPFVDLVNRSVSETMVRSLRNSLTIIFMLMAMFLLGGETIRYFSLALLIGTITGTYSSTFTAAPLLVVWNRYFKRH